VELSEDACGQIYLIAYENLSVSNMMKNHSLAKAIQDASWSGFWDKVDWKAKQNGNLAVAVDPEYLTQECLVCQQRLLFQR
jgi:putative transposase